MVCIVGRWQCSVCFQHFISPCGGGHIGNQPSSLQFCLLPQYPCGFNSFVPVIAELFFFLFHFSSVYLPVSVLSFKRWFDICLVADAGRRSVRFYPTGFCFLWTKYSVISAILFPRSIIVSSGCVPFEKSFRRSGDNRKIVDYNEKGTCLTILDRPFPFFTKYPYNFITR